MARVVVADAGPLIAFALVDALTLLRDLFGQVMATASVVGECLAKEGEDAGRIGRAIEEGWLTVVTLEEAGPPLSPSLGIGESDSIRYALQRPEQTLLIMDDRLARRYALKQGLNIVGTVGLLDLAERRGHAESAEQLITAMSDRGYRVSVDLLTLIRSG